MKDTDISLIVFLLEGVNWVLNVTNHPVYVPAAAYSPGCSFGFAQTRDSSTSGSRCTNAPVAYFIA